MVMGARWRPLKELFFIKFLDGFTSGIEFVVYVYVWVCVCVCVCVYVYVCVYHIGMVRGLAMTISSLCVQTVDSWATDHLAPRSLNLEQAWSSFGVRLALRRAAGRCAASGQQGFSQQRQCSQRWAYPYDKRLVVRWSHNAASCRLGSVKINKCLWNSFPNSLVLISLPTQEYM